MITDDEMIDHIVKAIEPIVGKSLSHEDVMYGIGHERAIAAARIAFDAILRPTEIKIIHPDGTIETIPIRTRHS